MKSGNALSPEAAYNATLAFFQDGGIFMYPILLTLALGIAIAIERWLFLSAARAANQKTWGRLAPLLTAKKFDQALASTREADSAVGRILHTGLLRRQTAERREEIEMAMEESLMETLPPFEKRTHYLATFANIATLLGLLGTIIGLIQAFTAMGEVAAAEKAKLLSASISVAMNTTAFGLMVAIPLLLVHSWLQARTTELVDGLEMAAVRFLNLVSQTPAEAPATTAPAATPLAAARPAPRPFTPPPPRS